LENRDLRDSVRDDREKENLMAGVDVLLSAEFNKFVLHHEPDYFVPLTRHIGELMPVAGRRVMDFGCGVGDLGFLLLQAGAAELEGVDIAAPAIDEAKRRACVIGLTKAQFFCCNLMTERWDGLPVDILVSHSAIHYIPLPLVQVLARLKDIVVPGGHIYLTMEAGRGSSLLTRLQNFNLRFAPEWIRRSFYYLLLPLLWLKGRGPSTPQEADILKAKSRYLAIPVVHATEPDQLAAAAQTAGFSEVQTGFAPLLHPLQMPHLFLTARRSAD
jgi:SAM-dependent methyltransferase